MRQVDDGGASDAAATNSARPPWPNDAPPAYACQVHADCQVAVWDAPQPDDPCCDSRVGYLAMSRKYLEFMASYKKANCGAVKCPPSPLPGAEPACCARIGRCVAKRCVTACEDPTAHPPQGSVLDPGCVAFPE